MNHNSDLQNSSTESTSKVPDASKVISHRTTILGTKHEDLDQFLSRAENLMKKKYFSMENGLFENQEKPYLKSVYFERFRTHLMSVSDLSSSLADYCKHLEVDTNQLIWFPLFPVNDTHPGTGFSAVMVCINFVEIQYYY